MRELKLDYEIVDSLPPFVKKVAPVYVQAVGGAEYVKEIDGLHYKYHQFAADSVLDVRQGGKIDYVIVGGGGAGGGARYGLGGGGGGGAVTERELVEIGAGEKEVVVGKGGVSTDTDADRSLSNGKASHFNVDVALGGGAGDVARIRRISSGAGGEGFGSGGGGAAVTNSADAQTSNGGYVAGHSGANPDQFGSPIRGGGGGGAGGDAKKESGGVGVVSKITGSMYGVGGDGAVFGVSETISDNKGFIKSGINPGDGGSGVSGRSAANWGINHGGSGADGVVIIRYVISESQYIAESAT